MKKIFSTILTVSLVLAGAILPATPSYADDEQPATPATWLQISPAGANVTLMGGDVLEGDSDKCPDDGCSVEVKNIGTASFRYKVYAALNPYVATKTNTDGLSEEAMNSFSQLVRWISFRDDAGAYQSQISKTIQPGETQKIYYKIEVPEDVPGGAQYAIIYAQTLPNGSTDKTGVQAQAQAGSYLTGRSIGDTRQTAEVTEYGFSRFSLGGPLKAHATVKNTGNTDFDLFYYYTARTLFGKEIYQASDSVPTFPGGEYNVENTWENLPFLGLFTIEYKLSGADLDKSETHVVLVMPVFVMVLLILLLTVIIVWIIIIIRKRKERKARTLV